MTALPNFERSEITPVLDAGARLGLAVAPTPYTFGLEPDAAPLVLAGACRIPRAAVPAEDHPLAALVLVLIDADTSRCQTARLRLRHLVGAPTADGEVYEGCFALNLVEQFELRP